VATVSNCEHLATVPVESGGRRVATLCVDCDEQLSAAWGCVGCEWETQMEQTLDGEVITFHTLRRRCRLHRTASA